MSALTVANDGFMEWYKADHGPRKNAGRANY